jgi:hypothetical protein
MGFPSLRVCGGPEPFFQSQRLKVGGSAARWVFVVTAILDVFQMCCLVKIAHYAVSNIGSVAISICTHNPINECKAGFSPTIFMLLFSASAKPMSTRAGIPSTRSMPMLR